MIPSLAPARLARPWRDDIMRLRPATRMLLLVLCGWAMTAAVLSAAVLLWPAALLEPGATLPAAGPHTPEDVRTAGAFTERALFTRTRHAAAEPVAIEAAQAAAPPTRDHGVGLKGIFINGFDARAFLTSGDEPKGRWVTTNDTIAGWTVASLTADAVRLTADDDSLTVSLHPAPSNPEAGAAGNAPKKPMENPPPAWAKLPGPSASRPEPDAAP